MAALVIAGQRFGALVAVSVADRPSNGQGVHWLCQCDCGSTSVARQKDLRNGNTASCGCQQKPRGRASKGVPTIAISRPWRKAGAETTATQSAAAQT